MSSDEAPSAQGIRRLSSGAWIGDIRVRTLTTAQITSTCIPNAIGDLLINITTGKLYIAGGTSASSDWKLVTSA